MKKLILSILVISALLLVGCVSATDTFNYTCAMEEFPKLPMAVTPVYVVLNGNLAPIGTVVTFECERAATTSRSTSITLVRDGACPNTPVTPKLIIQGMQGTCGGQIPIEDRSPITFYIDGEPALVREHKYDSDYPTPQEPDPWSETLPWKSGDVIGIDLKIGEEEPVIETDTTGCKYYAKFVGSDKWWIDHWRENSQSDWLADELDYLALAWYNPIEPNWGEINSSNEITRATAIKCIEFAKAGGYGCRPNLTAMIEGQNWKNVHTSYGWPIAIPSNPNDHWERWTAQEAGRLSMPSLFIPPDNMYEAITGKRVINTQPTNALTTATTTVPTTVPTIIQSTYTISDVEMEIFVHTNQERISNGAAPLTLDEDLSGIARAHSEDMLENEYFSHTNFAGQSPTDRAHAVGYMCGIGENIASIQDWNIKLLDVGEKFVEMWMDSPGHRENILKQEYTRIGVGVAMYGGKYIATQDFTGSVYCSQTSTQTIDPTPEPTLKPEPEPQYIIRTSNCGRISFVLVWDDVLSRWVWARAFLN